MSLALVNIDEVYHKVVRTFREGFGEEKWEKIKENELFEVTWAFCLPNEFGNNPIQF